MPKKSSGTAKKGGKKLGSHKGEKKKKSDLWCTGDLSIDKNGDLLIENLELGIVIERAWNKKRGSFYIYYFDPGSPGQKVNLQCPC